MLSHVWDTRGGFLSSTSIPDISTALMRPRRPKQYCLQLVYIYIYIYKYFKRKKDATTFSRQACFVNRFTLQGFKPLKSEAIHETGLSGKRSCVLFPLKIFIPLYFNVLSTVPRENRLADSLYIYIYIYIYIYTYKITKIVRALWLAERRVCMRVCKHGCVT